MSLTHTQRGMKEGRFPRGLVKLLGLNVNAGDTVFFVSHFPPLAQKTGSSAVWHVQGRVPSEHVALPTPLRLCVGRAA